MVILTRNFYEIISAKYMINIDDVRFIKDSTKENQIILVVFGFTDRIGEVIAKLQAFIMNFTTYITHNEFELQKEGLTTLFKNYILNPTAYSCLFEMITKVFMNNGYSIEAQLPFLETIKFEELIKFSKFFLNNYELKGFILGNLNPIQSFNIINKFSSVFILRNSKSSTRSKDLISSLISKVKKTPKYLMSLYYYISTIFTKRMDPGDQDYLQIKGHLASSAPLPVLSNSIKGFQKLDPLSLKRGSKIYSYYISRRKIKTDNTVLMMVAIGYNHLKSYVLTNILVSIISEEFFLELQIEKQLGHLADALYKNIVDHVAGISFNIVSSSQNVEILAENVLEFWNDWFSPDSTKMTETLFNVAKESYIQALKPPIVDLKELFSEFSHAITTKTYDFNWRSKCINYAEKLTYQEFLDWFKKIYDNSNIFMFAVQSPNSEESDILNSLSNYVPQDFTKLYPSCSLFNYESIRTYNQWNVYNEY
ncbi:peptidase insulinase like peptidase [Cryptosporidium sp. chipmunk genotype I]|uniref:peptidase insulinase like peptidase n=1 Tax=Cryptosporidium sp. chipmunk genotype I TaxID=1280935 RepID=UPI00351A933E|nr:peptidase insulinase like peptidase [Cryptosporidium sp. chipmunk genotype I]